MGSTASSPQAAGSGAVQGHERPASICGQRDAHGGALDDVKLIICSNEIVVFTSTGCGYCQNAQDLLGKNGLNFVSVVATAGQRQRLEMLTGSASVPSVWVKGRYIGGCNDGPMSWMGVRKMLANGLLKDFLK